MDQHQMKIPSSYTNYTRSEIVFNTINISI